MTPYYAGHGRMTMTHGRIQMVVVYSEHTVCTLCTSMNALSVLELAPQICLRSLEAEPKHSMVYSSLHDH